MATVAHTIYSRYDPKQRETLQRDTGQLEDDSDAEDDAWQIESNLAEKRRIAAYPRFVPATASYDDWGNTFVQGSSKQTLSQSDSAGWYRSLTTGRMNDSAARADTESPPAADVADALEGTPEVPVESIKRKVEPRTKNNWFIMRAMASEPSTTPDIPPPTIADMLERDPPPLPDEAQFEPPVFLALGPSNKGFTMLQQSGWNEGEALGPHARRRGLGSVNMMEERPTKRARTTEGRPV
ncbi:hypothetical protein PLICRDRAFT_43403 [Plicaturopsis crispa FD-325 SS-3]|nr:hypothetical protein PLICRDRAFT_43403 [Plicaturopsis crispa FD-325 SS-3]